MKTRKLIIHCSDSPYDHHGVESIRKWHKERGWSDIGYHWVIERSGELKKGRLYYPGAHTLGQNNETGICLCGLSGEFKNEQMKTLETFVRDNHFKISEIKQHSDFEPKKPFCAGLTESQIKYLNSLL
ncbi:MAG: N-acetylmuramoyl-L-alanine amidase [Asgard group archaeon]|nr:N-acetylmuramoyl-L-alanine amidase [Asgard group archaeon]